MKMVPVLLAPVNDRNVSKRKTDNFIQDRQLTENIRNLLDVVEMKTFGNFLAHVHQVCVITTNRPSPGGSETVNPIYHRGELTASASTVC